MSVSGAYTAVAETTDLNLSDVKVVMGNSVAVVGHASTNMEKRIDTCSGGAGPGAGADILVLKTEAFA